MANYQPLIAKAVAGLEKNTGEARRVLYERARNALVTQLRAVTPALSESDITRERLALEEAIRKVEGDAVRRGRAAPAPARPERAAGEAPPARPREAAGPPPQAAAGMAAPPPPADVRPVEPPQEPRNEAPSAEPRPEPTGWRRPRLRPAAPEPTPAAPHEAAASVPDTHAPAAAAEPPVLREPAKTEPLKRPGWPFRSRGPATPERDVGVPPAEPDVHFAPKDQAPPSFKERRDQGVSAVAAAGAPAVEGEPEAEPPEPAAATRGLPFAVPSRVAVIAAAIALAVLGLSGLTYWQWPTIAGLFAGRSSGPVATPAAPGTAPASRSKITDRVGAPTAPSPPPQEAKGAAQRVVLYEEDPSNTAGRRFVGTVLWRTESIAAGPGQALELAVRGEIEIPEAKTAVKFSVRRNTDKALPASHTIEIMFSLPADFPNGAITNIPGILMKQAEQTRGVPLAGLSVKVTPGFFLVGLSSAEADVQRNIQLLKERSWFDVPVVYSNGRRAILAIEKGAPGERAFADAFAAWGE